MSKQPRPKLRILLGAEIAIGPGKADLLDAVARTGSISAAAREMDMSYRRAWSLVDAMNRCFRMPLVEASKGGTGGGGVTVSTPRYSKILRNTPGMMAETGLTCSTGALGGPATLKVTPRRPSFGPPMKRPSSGMRAGMLLSA
ncbi:MAG: LysR family transcriptional regulator [Sphingopyxis terrae]|nr:MAG: LysR family transcriptional regulator [Sphingopyxis terrae]